MSLTERVLRGALEQGGLDAFADEVVEAESGRFVFRTAAPVALRRALIEDPRFWVRAGQRFEARQIGLRWTLHVKQFADWPADRFETHIDPIGAIPPWWAMPLWPLLLLAHAFDRNGYQDIERIAAALDR